MNSLRAHKKSAWEKLHGNWSKLLLITVICFIAGAYSLGPVPTCVYTPEQLAQDPSLLLDIRHAFVFDISSLRSVLFLMLGSVFVLGECTCYLNLADGHQLKIKDVFSCLPSLFRAIGLRFIRYLLLIGGLMLLIIPGVWFHYAYCFAPYLMVEDDSLTVREAMRMSRSLTRGHIPELILLDLSMIGWVILTLMTMGIGLVFLIPYQRTSRAMLYRYIKEKTPKHALLK